MQVKAAKIVERETPERAVSLYEKAADTVRNATFYYPAFLCLELVQKLRNRETQRKPFLD